MAGDRRSTRWVLLRERLRLAHRLLRVHPTMPATAFWRIFEAEVARRGLLGSGQALDLGCGDGSLAPVLLPSAPDLCWTGLDEDGYDAELARASSCYIEPVRESQAP